MNGLHFLIIVGLVHCALLFFNVIFVTCAHFPYIYFLKNTGLEIGIFRIKWCTTVLNKRLTRWGVTCSNGWSRWFDLGTGVCFILMPLSVGIIMKMSYSLLFAKSTPMDESSQVLQMMVPGIDFPLDQIGHYISALLLSSVIHEMGHAMAAVKEEVRLYNLGLSVTFVLAVAFANICSNQLSSLSPRKQLRILCAGVWHNVILALIGLIALGLVNCLIAPFYSNYSGISVKSLTANSPLLGHTGLKEMDVIYQVNNCSVLDSNDWRKCLLNILKQPVTGYCTSETFLKNNYKNQVDPLKESFGTNCCDAEDEVGGSLCFKYANGNSKEKNSCLQARHVLQNKVGYCQVNKDCHQRDFICVKPLLDDPTKMVEIKRTAKQDVLFVGHPADIYRTVLVSDWIPKYSFVNSDWPESLILLCKHIIVFSSGLAIINAFPCFFFDGQYIFTLLAHYLLEPLGGSKKSLGIFIFCAKAFFSVLLLVNITCMFVNKVF